MLTRSQTLKLNSQLLKDVLADNIDVIGLQFMDVTNPYLITPYDLDQDGFINLLIGVRDKDGDFDVQFNMKINPYANPVENLTKIITRIYLAVISNLDTVECINCDSIQIALWARSNSEDFN
jgi:hypothetical protein